MKKNRFISLPYTYESKRKSNPKDLDLTLYIQQVIEESKNPVEYTLEIDPGPSGGTKSFSGITGCTPDSPFSFPIIAGSGLQTKTAHNFSPISVIVIYNSNAKASSVILLKNGSVQQAIAVNSTPEARAFDPITISEGDIITVQGS